MGADLGIHIVNGNNDWWFCHTKLECDRDYDLFDAIRTKVITASVINKVAGYFGGNYHGTIKDAYNEPLRMCTALALLDGFKAIANLSRHNKAICAFLEASAEDTKIVLYWH